MSAGAIWAKMLRLQSGLALVEIPENVIVTDIRWPNRRPDEGSPAPVAAVAEVLMHELDRSFPESMALARKLVDAYIRACKDSVTPYPNPGGIVTYRQHEGADPLVVKREPLPQE